MLYNVYRILYNALKLSLQIDDFGRGGGFYLEKEQVDCGGFVGGDICGYA